MTESVDVVGVNAFVADVARMTREGGALDDASRAAAQTVLAPRAVTTRAAVPHQSGAMAATIAVKPEPYGAALTEGGDGVVYAGWVDFGGERPQSGPRPYLPQGRYLFPSAGDLEPPAVTAFDRELQATFDRYGWTNQGSDPGSVHG